MWLVPIFWVQMIRWTPTVKILHSLTGLSCTSWPGPIPIHLVSKIFQFIRQQLDAGASKDGHARGKWPFCKGSFTYQNNTLQFVFYYCWKWPKVFILPHGRNSISLAAKRRKVPKFWQKKWILAKSDKKTREGTKWLILFKSYKKTYTPPHHRCWKLK